jgi:hypothetical protein
VFFLEDKVNGGNWRVVVQKELHVRHVVAMVEDMILGVDIDWQSIMAFAKLQVDAENHDPSNVNEGEEVATIDVECVEALVKGGGWGGLSSDLNDVVIE